MATFKVKIADLIVEIDEKANNIAIFDDYLIENSEKCDFSIKNEGNDSEYIDIHKQIAEKLPIYQGFLMHGAAISYENKAFVFIAPSGTGKTTHISLWAKYLPDLKVINGDKPIIRQINGQNYVFGSPWSGKEGLNSNICVPLEAIIILKRADYNEIKEINPQIYINDILKQVYIPSDKNTLNLTVNLINSIFKNTKIYELKCTKNDDAFFTSYKALVGKEYIKNNK